MKAQFWSFDVIFAMIIFSFAIIILAYVWFSVNNQLSLTSSSGTEIIQVQANRLGQQLLSPGNPSNWETQINISNPATWNNIVSIGIGVGNNTDVLSQEKVMALSAMTANYISYQSTKQLLGISYDYYVSIKGNGFNIPIGFKPNTNNATDINILNEPVIIGNESAVMQVYVWTNTSFGIG